MLRNSFGQYEACYSLYGTQPSTASIDRVFWSTDTVHDLQVRLEVIPRSQYQWGLPRSNLELYDPKRLVRLYSFRQVRSGAADQIAVVARTPILAAQYRRAAPAAA